MFKELFHTLKNSFLSHKRYWGMLFLAVLVLLPIEFFIFSTKMTSEDELYWKSFLSNNKIFSVIVPRDLQFSNEKVPVYDFTVIESMERELGLNTYFHSQTIMMHKRANRWFPVIEPILKRNGVPDDFKYIVMVESNFSNIVSPKGATGFWQFLEGTAKQYGLEMNDEIDERYNIEKSTEAACKYFNEAYKTFGSWTLAAASYNIGMEGLKNQMEKQKAGSYYDLALNDETGRYIFRILSVKEIIVHPKNYGYLLRKKDLYLPIPTYKVSIDSSITDLADFAQKNNVNYKILKYFNPWLRKNSLTNKDKKTYSFQFPKPGFNEEYITRLVSSDSTNTRIEDSATIVPADTAQKK